MSEAAKIRRRWIYFSVSILLFFLVMTAVILFPSQLQPVKQFLPLALLVVIVAAGVNFHAIYWDKKNSQLSNISKGLISATITFSIVLAISFLLGLVYAIVKRI